MVGSTNINEIPDRINRFLKDYEEDYFVHSLFNDNQIDHRYISWAIEDSENTLCLWHFAEWDSELLGIKCGKIDKVLYNCKNDSKKKYLNTLFIEVLNKAQKENFEDIFFRTEPDFSIINCCEKNRFRTIGIHFDFIQSVEKAGTNKNLDNRIKDFTLSDLKNNLWIPKQFDDDRFHRSEIFDKKKITELWKNSITNAISEWAEKSYVLEFQGNVAGYVILIKDNSQYHKYGAYGIRIFLIAANHNYRRMGIGKSLLKSSVQYCINNDYPYLIVGTQSTNKTAISFYQSYGFKLLNTYQELSWSKVYDY